MTRIPSLAALSLAVAMSLTPAVATGQNRQELQMMADLRMLQEQIGKLQLAANQLADQINTTRGRVDEQAGSNLKSFANQQLLINNLSATLNTVREKLDDNTVRVSQLTQELSAIRSGLGMLTDQMNTLVSLLQPPTDPGAAPGTPASPASGGLGAVNVPPSPARYFELAFADYMSSRREAAIEGFTEFLAKFPDSVDAPRAAYFIGETYFQANNCKEAIPAYQRVVSEYKTSDQAPEALYMTGLCYSSLKDTARARSAFEAVRKQYPDSTAAIQAELKLRGMGVLR